MRTTIRLVGPAILLVLLMAGLSVASAQQGSNGSGGRIPTSVSLTPVEAWSCIKDQPVFTASAMDDTGGVQGARVEFILNRFPEAVGDIVEVAGNGPSKVDNTFASVFTNAGGQASATLTATRPGDTDVTAFVPAIQDSNAHKTFGVMHWVDGCPAFPGDAENPIGFNHPMGVTVHRVSDGSPVEGVSVRWTIIGDDPDAQFVGAVGDGNSIVAPTDATGVSNVILEQVASLIGDNEVYIEVLNEDGETMFAQSMVKNWKSPILGLTASGPATAGLLRNVTYDIVVSNTGDFLATETVLTMELPAGLGFVSAAPAATVTNAEGGLGQLVTWNLGEVAIGGSVPLSITAQAVLTGSQPSSISVASAEGLSAQASVVTTVIPGVLEVDQTGPSTVDLGSEATYSISVLSTGTGANTQIKLIDTLPAGMSFVSADREPIQVGNQLTFDLGTLNQGALATVEIVLQATQPGAQVNSVRATSAEGASDDDSVVTQVVRPVLAVTKTGPESALINTDFDYSITVENIGDGTAYSATLTDTLPAGLTYVSSSPEATVDGSTVTWSLGNIGSSTDTNNSSTVTLTVRATEGGVIENSAVAAAEGVGVVAEEARASTTILVPEITIEKTGRSAMFVGNQATYMLTATNSGDAPLTGVTITEGIPAGMSYVSSDPVGTVSEDMTQVVWDVGSLEVDASTSVTVTLQAEAESTITNTASATAAEGASDTSELSIQVLAAPGATLAITDSFDPLRVGETVDFTVTVGNQGRSAISGITVTVALDSAAMTYVASDIVATVSSNGTTMELEEAPVLGEDGSTVTFTLLSDLPLHDTLTFVVSAQANALPENLGPAMQRLDTITTATLVYDQFGRPVSAEEGTTIIEQ